MASPQETRQGTATPQFLPPQSTQPRTPSPHKRPHPGSDSFGTPVAPGTPGERELTIKERIRKDLEETKRRRRKKVRVNDSDSESLAAEGQGGEVLEEELEELGAREGAEGEKWRRLDREIRFMSFMYASHEGKAEVIRAIFGANLSGDDAAFLAPRQKCMDGVKAFKGQTLDRFEVRDNRQYIEDLTNSFFRPMLMSALLHSLPSKTTIPTPC